MILRSALLGAGGLSSIVIPAGSRNFAPASTVTTAGGVAGAINGVLRLRNNTGATLKNLQALVYRFGFDATMSVIRAVGNDLLYRHSLEIGGTRYQMLKSGSADFVLPAATDWLYNDKLAQEVGPGAVFNFRHWLNLPAGEKYIGGQGSSLATLGDANSYGSIASQPDRTMTGSPTAGNTNGGINALLFAEAPAGTASTLILEDSIGSGLNEVSLFTGDANGNIGPANRFLASKGHNTLNLGKPTSRAQQWSAADKSLYSAAFGGVTFYTLWIGLGRNDYAANRTAAQIKADVEALIAWAKATWPTINRVIVRDLPPSTTGDWTTVEGQNDRTGSAITQEAERVSYNAIVAAKGIVGQTDYFAFAPSCQTTKANGTVVWVANGTTDGIHPVGAVNAAAVTANAALPA